MALQELHRAILVWKLGRFNERISKGIFKRKNCVELSGSGLKNTTNGITRKLLKILGINPRRIPGEMLFRFSEKKNPEKKTKENPWMGKTFE